MTENKKNIVLLTTWFPPLESVAVNRMAAFAKYLDKTKFNLHVITVGTNQIYGNVTENDYQVIRIKPEEKFTIQFKNGESKWSHRFKVLLRKTILFFQGDEHKAWQKAAFNELKNLDNKLGVDAVISSFSPAAPHLVALQFVKQKNIPWITDMRDEMSLNPQSDAKQKKYFANIEKEINQYATALITVSQPIAEYFKTTLPDLKYFEEVRNGYDHDFSATPDPFNSELTFLHAGSFYGTRKPDTFLEALSQLNEENSLPKNWKFICAGAARNFSVPANIKDHVELISRVSQQESLQLMSKADFNVLIQPPTGRKGVYTGKIFDYLSVCRPVLAVVDKTDVAAEMIKELNAGLISDFYNIDEIKEMIQHSIRNWKQKISFQMNFDEVKKLHRKIQVEKLNQLLNKLLNEN